MSCIKQAKARPDTSLTYFFRWIWSFVSRWQGPSISLRCCLLTIHKNPNQQLAMNYDKNFEECSHWKRGEFLRTEVISTNKNKWIIFGKQWEDRSDQLCWSKYPGATEKFTRENTNKNLRNPIYKRNGKYWKWSILGLDISNCAVWSDFLWREKPSPTI